MRTPQQVTELAIADAVALQMRNGEIDSTLLFESDLEADIARLFPGWMHDENDEVDEGAQARLHFWIDAVISCALARLDNDYDAARQHRIRAMAKIH